MRNKTYGNDKIKNKLLDSVSKEEAKKTGGCYLLADGSLVIMSDDHAIYHIDIGDGGYAYVYDLDEDELEDELYPVDVEFVVSKRDTL